ncbi:MAG: hypothetical protein KDC37_00795 [Flavobacteriales bacterium]|nr:hypothetical protein [Flavobacteriales bacterium]
MRILALILVCFWALAMPLLNKHDLERLPVLFEHYAQHQAIYPDLSFYEFLLDHYSHTEHHRDHDTSENGEELPFDHHQCQHHLSGAELVIPATAQIRLQVQHIPRRFYYLNPEGILTTERLLDPPRA